MNTQSVDCRRVPNPLPEGFELKPGDFSWSDHPGGRRVLYLCLPGEKHMDAIPVTSVGTQSRVWNWDGNEEKPTLTPSIEVKEKWHGHLQAGRLVSV
jgi:hypothetical protein